MATRDVLDYQGNVIGDLTLPDDTTEDQWTRALCIYAIAPPVKSPTAMAADAALLARNFGRDLITTLQAENMAMGLAASGKMLDVIQFGFNLLMYLNIGALPAAISEIDRILAAGIPENLAPFMTTARMTANRAKIANFLGVP